MMNKDIHFNRSFSSAPSVNNGKTLSRDPGYNQIISTISHELRTPVAIIKSNIQLLRKFSYDMDGAVLEESFTLCEESVDNVARFLDNIQMLNSANKSRIHPVHSSFRAKEIVHHLFNWLDQRNLDYHRVVLQWDLKDQEIISDKQYLSQILLNILSNALKFSREKVLFIISTCTQELSILVQDWGLGIPEEEMDLIFQPFFRASNVKHISGTGLGLAIVHSLVENLGGEIQISSALGKGTTIHITIPYEASNQNSRN